VVSAPVGTWTFAASRKRCVDYDDLPPDLTADGDCPAVYGGPEWPYFCTRSAGHRGRHAAGDGAERGCDWTAYGLIPGPWEIVFPAEGDVPGRTMRSFPFADAGAVAR
jgi:hypothetical protein